MESDVTATARTPVPLSTPLSSIPSSATASALRRPIFPSQSMHLSLRAKLWIVFGGLLVILLVVSGISVVVLTYYTHLFETVFHRNYDTLVYCQAMTGALDKLDELIQRDESAGEASVVSRWEQTFSDNIARQERNCSLPTEQNKSDAILSDWERYQTQYEALRRAQGANRDTVRNEMLLLSRSMRARLQDVTAMNLRNMVAVDGQVRVPTTAVRNALLVAAAAGLVLAVLFIGVAGPSMLRPLSALTRSARQIADGQLDLSVQVHTRDEVGQLAEAFNMMAERLRDARRLDRERLTRTEQSMQRAIDSLPDAVVVLGSDGRVELANRVAENVFGLVPRSLAPLPAWIPSLHEHVLKGERSYEPDGYRSAIQKFCDGDERFFLPHAVPLRGEDGRPVGVTVVLADVTRLKQADEAKSDLVSTVSHELRTPLTSIRMAVHMLAEELYGPLRPEQAELLKTACENSDRLHRTLENLLGISRIESGRTTLRLEPMTAAEIISTSTEPLRQGYHAAGIQIVSEVTPTDLSVRADRSCVTHVLTNLLGNALQHTPRGGEVKVDVRSGPTHATFTVTDNGRGIPPEHLPRIFEKFYRVPTPGPRGGAGLGLAIAKEIVEAHGGTIGAAPATPAGVTFTFTLPMDRPSA